MEFFQHKKNKQDKKSISLFDMHKYKEAIVLAGGFGTRLQSVVSDLPKPMAEVADLPFLVYIIKYLKHYEINRVILSVGYLSEKIREYFQDEYMGVSIVYSQEQNPLGTGGGIKLALAKCSNPNIFVLNGDSFFDVDLFELEQMHNQKDASATLAIREVENVGRYGEVLLDDDNKIIQFSEKTNKVQKGYINGGVYLLKAEVLDRFEEHTKFSLEKDFFQREVASNANIYGQIFDSFFIDIGVPSEYLRARKIFKQFQYWH